MATTQNTTRKLVSQNRQQDSGNGKQDKALDTWKPTTMDKTTAYKLRTGGPFVGLRSKQNTPQNNNIRRDENEHLEGGRRSVAYDRLNVCVTISPRNTGFTPLYFFSDLS